MWDPVRVNQCVPKLTSLLLPSPPPLIVLPTWSFLQDPMITGQLSKPLLPLRADMDACELRDDDKAASPDSELTDEPLLLSADTDSEEKMYGESQPSSSLLLWLTPRGHVRGELNTDECVCLFVSARCCGVESAGTEQVKVVVQVYCVSYSFWNDLESCLIIL